jgi:hypothetical protein
MIKKIFVFILLVVSIEAQSQVLISLLLGDKINSDGLEFGLEGGINYSKISGLETNNFHQDWNMGFYFDIKLKTHWYFYTGVLVKSNLGVAKLTDNDIAFLGIDTYSVDGSYNQKVSTFIMPALAKYRFDKGFYFEAGPQFGLMHKAWVEFNYDLDGKKAIIQENNKDMIRRIDAGLAAGMGYRFKGRTGWTWGVKYYYGFIDVYKDRAGTKNSSIYLKLNIPIGASEKAQLKREGKAKKKAKKKLNKGL